MPHYYLAPFEGAGSGDDPFRPVGVLGDFTILDLRPWGRDRALVGQSVRNDLANTTYLGEGKAAAVSAAQRRKVEQALGITLTATTIAGIVAEIGVQLPGLMPEQGRWRIWLGGELHYDAPAARGGASYADDFNRANGAPGAPWKVVSPDFSIVSNEIDAINADSYMRYETELATADHECEVKVVAGTHVAALVRCDTPATDTFGNATFYSGRRSELEWQILRWTPSGVTFVALVSESSPTVPYYERLKVEGSTLTFYYGTASPAGTQKAQGTDTAITGFKKVGVHSGTADGMLDDWRAADLGAAPVTITRTPTTNTAVTTGWTNPANANTDDAVYATAAPAKNATINSDWGGFGFDSAIPNGATINSVTVEVQWLVSTTGSIATLGSQVYVGGTAQGTELVNTAEPLAETKETYTVSGLTRDNLLDANFKVRVRATRGNTNTAFTASLDVVKVTVDYSGGSTPVGVSLDARWNARAAVARPTDARWATRSLVARTSDQRWGVRTSASRTVDARWDGRSLAARAVDARWNSIAHIARTLDARWNVLVPAARAVDARWAARTLAVRQVDARWTQRSLTARPVDARWDVRGAVARAPDVRWAIRVPVVLLADLRWQVAGAVGRGSDLRWAQRAAVARATDLRWGIGGYVAVMVDARWNVLTPAVRAVDARWAARGVVGRQSDVRWAVRAPVGRSVDLRWDVQSLAAVGQQVDLRWSIAGPVGRTLDTRWALRAPVARSLTLNWIVRTTLGRTFDLPWSVRVAVGRLTDARWAARVMAGTQTDLRWDVLVVVTTVSRLLDLRWAILVPTSRLIDLRWSVQSFLIVMDPSTGGALLVMDPDSAGNMVSMSPASSGAAVDSDVPTAGSLILMRP